MIKEVMKALVLSSGASHGAFQSGVLVALDELGWTPDLILGTSVGAINGVGYVSGLSGNEVADLWHEIRTKDVYRWRPWKDWFRVLSWNYILDTSPLKQFLRTWIDMDSVYESDQTMLVAGVDIRTGGQCFFSSKLGKEIAPIRNNYQVRPLDYNSIMSSAAIPGVFPWQDGVWDGAFQQHNPLKPAVLMGATEILVVHLDVFKEETSMPNGLLQTAWRVIELSTSYHLLRDVNLLRERNALSNYRQIDVNVVCPQEPLGYSKLNFDDSLRKLEAIESGYEVTMDVLGP